MALRELSFLYHVVGDAPVTFRWICNWGRDAEGSGTAHSEVGVAGSLATVGDLGGVLDVAS